MKKKREIIIKLIVLEAVIALIVTGCSQRSITKAPTSGPYYWVYVLFGHPIQNIMIAVKNAIAGPNGAGWAITIITFAVRLILMPFMLSSQKKAVRQQEKVAKLQPQMQRVQKALKRPGLTQAQQMELSQLQMRIYRENNLSMMGGMGCLPLLIQLPIMVGIYQAVAYSKALAETSFFGISLGQRSLLLTIIATALYVVQGYISLIGIPAQQKKAMQATVALNPLMTFLISISAPGALTLYFLVGGIIAIIQQLITTFLLQPTVKKEVAKELAKEPIKEVVSEQTIADMFDAEKNAEKRQETQDMHEDLRKRNEERMRKLQQKHDSDDKDNKDDQ